jgi:DNA-nicking Smr family endonuclease
MADIIQPDSDAQDPNDGEAWIPETVVVPITDELDLHTFNPRELDELIPEYLRACREKGILNLRIVHGKGRGILKKRVRAILKKESQVVAFDDAPPEAGGWGATRVQLTPDP